MWMEEELGTRINGTRMDEALATGAEQVAVACPFCRATFGDSLTTKQAGEGVAVVDVAQMPPFAGVTREETGERLKISWSSLSI